MHPPDWGNRSVGARGHQWPTIPAMLALPTASDEA